VGKVNSVIRLAAIGALALTAACGGGSSSDKESASSTSTTKAPTLRLGYFANVTHASAVYGVASGGFQKALGDTALKTSVFNAGPAAIEAMRGNAIDATFIGPNPAINGFSQTDGKLLRIVAGTTSGGAALVVKPEITSVEQLAGKKVATPQLGNTQDVAAKAYFKDKGIKVNVVNQENAQTLDLFKNGKIDGGWVPEPWASRLVLDGGGKVLLDEKTLWPQGEFVTTHLVVRQEFLEKYPDTVEALLKGLIAATDVVATKSAEVQSAVNAQLLKDTGKQLKEPVLKSAFDNLTPTLDPIASSLAKSAEHAQAIGLLKPVELKGIYDLTLLNKLLTAAGKPEVQDADLGV
jgi:NitT/TauT family transport system substrate-binding protein